ncbi:MAG: metalloregulator ArsR/SmtB family transcription factor [Candidatus Pacebacteria bacterium]|nr:metalloregulator ArsR/SmtB family transcription factor [Candidatus Paceibacterota bacterium]PIR63456.1 MAG: hypothetical protein COU64_04635 [Candidatus Pacebacteria bacterium CG10_big_fil_rev_8_21_14_0_10_40_26]PIZ79595.1 MAG: hypothetical protein COY01_00540 [Candidatus Pacebacteria bacterium CG_4_10_14_0_2_um_filter_40_20]PJA69048.1 MAG: hypothetical protein CO156_01790 [Candidatus Pacebacteria bacterium CG_4_9_14_3_um_filter_40_12]PJC41819.1 MAG: hypothetical protein CO041_03815 [Candida
MYEILFTKQADLLKALSNSRRLEIIHLLRDQQLPVTDIYTMLDLPQANISQHLMVLRDAGVVKTKKQGKQVYYSLTHPNIIAVSDLLRELLIDTSDDTSFAEELKYKMKELVPIVQDPVCGMRVSPKTAAFQCEHEGHDYFFCASGCLTAFKKGPSKYVQK